MTKKLAVIVAVATICYTPAAHADPVNPIFPVTRDEHRMIAELRADGIGLGSTDWEIADAAVGVCNAQDHIITTEEAGQAILKDLGPGLTRSQINTFQVVAVRYECPQDLQR